MKGLYLNYSCSRLLPRPFNPERAQSSGFAFIEKMLDQAIHAAAARAAAQAGAQLVQVGFVAVDYYLHIAIFGVAHPAAQIELAGLAMDIPAEAYALYAALNEEVKNHC